MDIRPHHISSHQSSISDIRYRNVVYPVPVTYVKYIKKKIRNFAQQKIRYAKKISLFAIGRARVI